MIRLAVAPVARSNGWRFDAIRYLLRRKLALVPIILVALTEGAWAQAARQSTHNVIILLLQIFPFYALMFAALSGWWFYTARKFQALADASSQWPTASGKVLASGVSARLRTKGGGGFTPDVRYEYAVAGARHEGSVIQFGAMDQPTSALAEKMLAPYPVGATVTVHYKPDDPKTATLDTNSNVAKTRRIVAIAVLVAGIVVYGIVAAVVLSTV